MRNSIFFESFDETYEIFELENTTSPVDGKKLYEVRLDGFTFTRINEYDIKSAIELAKIEIKDNQ